MTAAADIARLDDILADRRLLGDLRSDHAGETGAVWIYRGILTFSKDPAVRAFAEEHMATEAQHLDLVCDILPPAKRSLLTPAWKVAGWLTGALPALFGSRAVYLTIEAVETFVDRHYQEQIDYLDEIDGDPALRALLVTCQADEVHHRDEAREAAGGPPGPVARLWTNVVGAGSQGAVKIARVI
ncbi:MAG: demethoxyubiquinone hydroxylase family protein [Pseudomonadota bacterium]